MTTMPLAEAEGMSTLSTPMPARPTTFKLVAASSTSLVTLVEERIARPSYWPMIAISSSLVLPVISSTSTPRLRKIWAASGSMASEIRTLGIGRSLNFGRHPGESRDLAASSGVEEGRFRRSPE
jgi:hypothetical protein